MISISQYILCLLAMKTTYFQWITLFTSISSNCFVSGKFGKCVFMVLVLKQDPVCGTINGIVMIMCLHITP